VEEAPFSKLAWLDRARFAETSGDESVRIASLVSAVDADPTDVDLMKEAAFQLCRYVGDHAAEIPKARRGVYLASVRAHMERIVQKLDADGLSRLAWLFLLEGNVTKTREYANRGCALDPTNGHCLRILEQLKPTESDRLVVLTPYKNQASAILRSLNERGLGEIEVLNVHKSQGREWDTVIFSVVDGSLPLCRPWFTTSSKPAGTVTLNSALSRVRKDLFIVCEKGYWVHRPQELLGDLLALSTPFAIQGA
jgi:hypothetical protein